MRLLVWLLEQGPFVDWVRDKRLPLILILIPPLEMYHLPIICVIALSGDLLYHSCMFTHKTFLPQPMDYNIVSNFGRNRAHSLDELVRSRYV